MRQMVGLAIIFLANTALAADTAAPKPSRPAAVEISPAKPTTRAPQPLSPLKRIVVMPEVTEGAKRVNQLRSEHSAGAVMATASAMAVQLKPANKRLTEQVHIISINDKSFASTWIVPGAPYVIKGWGFGTTPGEVKLIGGFPNSAPRFRIDLWQDKVIYAYLEDDISGAYDQQNVTLAISAPGVLWTRKNVKFFATREVRDFPLSPNFETVLNGTGDMAFSAERTAALQDGFLRVHGRMDWWAWQVTLMDGCAAYPYDMKYGGVDTFRISNFKPGWSAVGLEWYVGRTTDFFEPFDYQGNPGVGLSAVPDTYHAKVEPTKFTIDWAVYNSITQKPCEESNPAFSSTEYRIKGFAEGPRGTAIF